MARPKPRAVPFPSEQLRPVQGICGIPQQVNVYLPLTLPEALYEARQAGVDLDVSEAAQCATRQALGMRQSSRGAMTAGPGAVAVACTP